jgi:hypothetical protein
MSIARVIARADLDAVEARRHGPIESALQWKVGKQDREDAELHRRLSLSTVDLTP